jgi:leucyl-tRNA synthetase
MSDPSSRGKLVTVAYPYMNGRLHMGHAMTIANADAAARWRRQQGMDVLFPFGFHCTGMPIYASAQKLSHGDSGVYDSLLGMGVPEDQIDAFKDPGHWVQTFPALALEDLKRFNLCCDFTRSFVTTDANPYYDSFVRWQYDNLHKGGRLTLANRPCIYSVMDRQPCADHDRQSGEGVKPIPYRLCHLGDGFKVIRSDQIQADEIPSPMNAPHTPKILRSGLDEGERYVQVQTVTGIFHGKIPDYWYSSMKYQGINVTVMEGEVPTPKAPITLELPKFTDTGVELWFPESEVISRTGDRCIVAKVPQWYLTYSDPEWKAAVQYALDRMTLDNPDVRTGLQIALDEMEDWCVSREYGLGTRLPCDPKFLIDSLSDSTIYMAYYTIAHMLHRDIYGQQEIIPISQVDNHFWDAVFLGQSCDGHVVEKAREEFLRYYPPSVRVSGKDLIYNHLIMSIYHHVAIFGKDIFCQEYLINGYAKLNGKKMSKSTGNFITLHDALETYPRIDALRVLLLEAGDGLEDANIRLNDYNTVCDAISQVQIQEVGTIKVSLRDYGHIDYHWLYVQMLVFCYQEAQRSFARGRFREGMTYGWRKVMKILGTYLKTQTPDPNIVDFARHIASLTLGPVIGVDNTSNLDDSQKFLQTYQVSLDNIYQYYEFVQGLYGHVRKYLGKNIPFQIQIHDRLRELIVSELDLIVQIRGLHASHLPDITFVYDKTPIHPNCDPWRQKPKIITTEPAVTDA